ncbi:MAG TPA: Gfo/Idh/MocA family oxidoreductase [Opitutaceae bacterium]|nr:Gfo/Idh/MocA family oxidoreductase [Opitutaceae bacterium]
MPRPLPRAAIIGISGYGKIYLERLLHHADAGELEIAAATVINRPEEQAACAGLEQRGARIHPEFHQMLEAHAGRLDLVLIPTGIHWHARMTLAALAAGANVLVEKPLAATIQDVREIERTAPSSGRFVAVGFQDIYVEENQEVKRRLLAGALGRVRRIRGRGLWPRSSAYYARNDWAGRLRLDGSWVLDSPLANALAHFLNLALFLGGESEHESARPVGIEAELYRARPIESYDTAAVRIATAGGAEICFYASHSCERVLEPELAIDGEAGSASWTAERGWRLQGAAVRTLPGRGETPARAAMFRSVLRRMEEPGAFVCGPAIAAQHTLCANGAHAATVIRDVPAGQVRHQRADGAGAVQPVIEGLERCVDRAFLSGKLLHESGCAWASPAGRISLDQFASFPP